MSRNDLTFDSQKSVWAFFLSFFFLMLQDFMDRSVLLLRQIYHVMFASLKMHNSVLCWVTVLSPQCNFTEVSYRCYNGLKENVAVNLASNQYLCHFKSLCLVEKHKQECFFWLQSKLCSLPLTTQSTLNPYHPRVVSRNLVAQTWKFITWRAEH